MLESVHGQKGLLRGVLDATHTHDTTLLVRPVVELVQSGAGARFVGLVLARGIPTHG